MGNGHGQDSRSSASIGRSCRGDPAIFVVGIDRQSTRAESSNRLRLHIGQMHRLLFRLSGWAERAPVFRQVACFPMVKRCNIGSLRVCSIFLRGWPSGYGESDKCLGTMKAPLDGISTRGR